jgi:hypothetical protein
MNTILRGSFLFLALLVGAASAKESTVNVASSRELRLAIVDTKKASADRDAAYSTFATCLGQAVSQQGVGEVGVKVKCVSADHAAFNLGTGVYDAVLVLSGSLPRALMISDVVRLSGTLGAGKGEKKVYLIFPNADETLAKLLSSSFSLALTDNRFLDALEGVSHQIAAAGQGPKVAATP